MASAVGSTTNLTLRSLASRSTSSMTGRRPYAPVPMTRHVHFHGMFSSTDSGVWPNVSRNFLDAFFFRRWTSPRSTTRSCSYVTPSISMTPNSKCPNRILHLARRLLSLDELRMLCQQPFRNGTPDVRHQIGPAVHDIEISTEPPQFPLDAAGRRRRLATASQLVPQHRDDLVGETKRRIDDEQRQVRPHQAHAIEESADLAVAQMFRRRRLELDVDQLPLCRSDQIQIAADAAGMELDAGRDVEAEPAAQLASDVPLQCPAETGGPPHEAVSITPVCCDHAQRDERLRERPRLVCTHIARRLVWREAIAVVNHAAHEQAERIVPEPLGQGVGRFSGDVGRERQVGTGERWTQTPAG